MKHAVLRALTHIWARIDEHEALARTAACQGREECGRLLRTSHRGSVLRFLYWEGRTRISVNEIAELAGLMPSDLPGLAGPLLVDTTCLACGRQMKASVENRTALDEFERESTLVLRPGAKDPRFRVCAGCRQVREHELRGLSAPEAGRKARYVEYLKSPEWAARRQKALRRAGNRCQMCASRFNLEVHHRDYNRVGRERPVDLTVVCNSCHGDFHHT